MKKLISIIVLAAGLSGQIFAGVADKPTSLVSINAIVANEVVIEAISLAVENWMIETVSMDTRLELEDWMISGLNNSFSTQKEEEINTEQWMLNSFSVAEEKEIEVENWMFVFHR